MHRSLQRLQLLLQLRMQAQPLRPQRRLWCQLCHLQRLKLQLPLQHLQYLQ